MKKMLLYLDTSVFGGVFDDEFMVDSKRVIEYLKNGTAQLLISDTVIAEINRAPEHIKNLLTMIPPENVKFATDFSEANILSEQYLGENIVSAKWKEDTLHVALATINHADAIVSWNFKHIVRLDKIKAYNQVNLQNNYGIITIISPKEVFINNEE